jgi:hypothetical protein
MNSDNNKEEISGISTNPLIQDLYMYSIWTLIYIRHYTILKMFVKYMNQKNVYGF